MKLQLGINLSKYKRADSKLVQTRALFICDLSLTPLLNEHKSYPELFFPRTQNKPLSIVFRTASCQQFDSFARLLRLKLLLLLLLPLPLRPSTQVLDEAFTLAVVSASSTTCPSVFFLSGCVEADLSETVFCLILHTKRQQFLITYHYYHPLAYLLYTAFFLNFFRPLPWP